MGLWRVRGGVPFVEWTSHGTPALPRSTLMVLRADRVCCGGYRASASRFGGAALFGGALDDVKRSTRSCWTGSLVSPCAIPSRRVGFLVAACCGFALRYDMWAARSPLEERVYSRRRPVASTGARRRRACVERSRPPLSLWWLVLERERERRRHFPSVSRSLHRLCVRSVVFVYVSTETWWLLLLLRDRPRLRPRSGRPQLAPRSQCVRAALCVV